jgi:3'-phosphoadenosine 5'-phosphosulfate sulfotransferase (PAPS reductase)/FAD synthetase
LKEEVSRMDHYDMLENKSIYIIREAYYRFKNIAMLWSVGKDSTTLLWLIRKAFFGKIPFPIIHIDTSYKFPDMYEFRDKLSRDWGFPLIVGVPRILPVATSRALASEHPEFFSRHPELLSGHFYRPLDTAVPHQLFASSMLVTSLILPFIKASALL